MSESASGEQSGAARWLSVHDDLLRGLTHSLSNRLGTISALAYMIELKPDSLGTSAATLRAESERLDALLQLLRVLPRRSAATAEPIVPTDTTTMAVALQLYHPDVHDVGTIVTIDGDLQPAYADPSALVMAVSLILGAAHRAIPADRAAHVEVTISSSTDTVRFSARGVHADGTSGHADADTASDVRAVNWLLAAFGGSGMADTGGADVIIPTLQAARRARRG